MPEQNSVSVMQKIPVGAPGAVKKILLSHKIIIWSTQL